MLNDAITILKVCLDKVKNKIFNKNIMLRKNFKLKMTENRGIKAHLFASGGCWAPGPNKNLKLKG